MQLLALLYEFEDCCTVIVKHNNPCGVSIGTTLLQSYISAREADPISAYGSVVACNREINSDLAKEICKPEDLVVLIMQ
jgi:phosphoribosylaminoimidazolecarboxamide formyltransferase/IMP cyclohydrolase